MPRYRNLYRISKESEEVVVDTVIEEDPAIVNEELQEVDTLVQETEDLNEVVEETSEVAENLAEDVQQDEEKLEEPSSVTEEDVVQANESLVYNLAKLGYPYEQIKRMKVSSEAVTIPSERLRLSVEEKKGILATIWDKIKTFFTWIWDKIVAIAVKIVNLFKPAEKKLMSVKEQIKEVEKNLTGVVDDKSKDGLIERLRKLEENGTKYITFKEWVDICMQNAFSVESYSLRLKLSKEEDLADPDYLDFNEMNSIFDDNLAILESYRKLPTELYKVLNNYINKLQEGKQREVTKDITEVITIEFHDEIRHVLDKYTIKNYKSQTFNNFIKSEQGGANVVCFDLKKKSAICVLPQRENKQFFHDLPFEFNGNPTYDIDTKKAFDFIIKLESKKSLFLDSNLVKDLEKNMKKLQKDAENLIKKNEKLITDANGVGYMSLMNTLLSSIRSSSSTTAKVASYNLNNFNFYINNLLRCKMSMANALTYIK